MNTEGRMTRKTSKAVLVALMLGAAACSSDEVDQETPQRTDRERDDLIGQSALPGARGVRGAQRIADSASVRAARLDSIANSN